VAGYVAPELIEGTPYPVETVWQPLVDEVEELSAAAALGLCKARGTLQADTSTTGTELGVLLLPVGTLTYGHLYQVTTTTLCAYCDANSCGVYAQVRYTTNGVDPTTASTIMPGSASELYPTNNATLTSLPPISATYTPSGASENLTLLLTVGVFTGSGNFKILANAGAHLAELRVMDLGLDLGDTGESP